MLFILPLVKRFIFRIPVKSRGLHLFIQSTILNDTVSRSKYVSRNTTFVKEKFSKFQIIQNANKIEFHKMQCTKKSYDLIKLTSEIRVNLKNIELEVDRFFWNYPYTNHFNILRLQLKNNIHNPGASLPIILYFSIKVT